MLQVLWRFFVKLSPSGYCVVNDDVLPLTINVQNFSVKVIHMRSKILQKVMMLAHTRAGEASPFEYQRSCYKCLADVCSEFWQAYTNGMQSTGPFLTFHLPFLGTGLFVWSTFWRFLQSYQMLLKFDLQYSPVYGQTTICLQKLGGY